MRPMRAACLVVAVAAGLVLSAGLQSDADSAMPPEARVPVTLGDDTPNCATHNEWDRVDVFMTPATVADIVGNNGDPVGTPSPDTVARVYNLCWTDNRGKVWYWEESRLSFRKDIVNP